MLPSINCERGHLTHNSCFKYSRWHCAHKPLLPLAPGLCLSLVGSWRESWVWPWLATDRINSNVSSMVIIIHSFSSHLLNISYLEGTGTGQSKTWYLASWSLWSSEHMIWCSGGMKRKEAFTGPLWSSPSQGPWRPPWFLSLPLPPQWVLLSVSPQAPRNPSTHLHSQLQPPSSFSWHHNDLLNCCPKSLFAPIILL